MIIVGVNLTSENSGPIVFLGGLLLLITSILEFILGNTFPCVVFGTIGEFTHPGRYTTDSKVVSLIFHARRVLVRLRGYNDPRVQCSWCVPS